MNKTFLKSFLLSKVKRDENGCWVWQLKANNYGYAQVRYDNKNWRAHRLSYIAFKGKIKNDLPLDHLCRVRNCINPEHLEPVTSGENVLRGEGKTAQNARKKECLRGHPFDEKNTYTAWSPNGNPQRICRKCRAYQQRECQKRKKLKANLR